MKFLVLGFLFSLSVYALEVTVHEDLKNFASENVNSELHFRAEKALIDQTLRSEAIPALPWEKWEAEFSTQLKKDPKLTRERFYDLNRFFTKSTIKENVADPEKLGFWTMKLDGEVDLRRLKAWALQAHAVQKNRYEKLWVHIKIEPHGFDWKDLKLTTASEFVQSFSPLWINYVRDLGVFDATEILVCHESCEQSVSTWQGIEGNKLKDSIPFNLKNSLLMTLNVNLTRTALSGAWDEYRFDFKGGLIVEDLNTKEMVFHSDLPTEQKTLTLKQQKEFNSSLASFVYRYPLGVMTTMKGSSLVKSDQFTQYLTIRGANGLSDIYKLKEVLELEGMAFGLQAKLDFYSQKEAKLLIQSRQGAKKVKDLIQSSKKIESKSGRKFEVKEEGVDTVLQFL
jgi:hypothetical protein